MKEQKKKLSRFPRFKSLTILNMAWTAIISGSFEGRAISTISQCAEAIGLEKEDVASHNSTF